MPPSNQATRRAVVAALGGAGISGAITGSVTAAGGKGPGKGRETHTDKGIVIQFEDCQTAHVRGSKNKLEELVVHYLVCIGGGGPCPDGQRVVIRDDPPLTIDDRFLPGGHEDYRIVFIEYFKDDGDGLAEIPDEWDCSF